MLKTHIVIFAHFGSAKNALDSALIAESGADSCVLFAESVADFLFVESSGRDSLFVESNDDFCV